MQPAEIVVGALRLAGVAYVVGGAYVVRQCVVQIRCEEAADALLAALAAPGETPQPDPARVRWLLTGGVLTVLAGLALALAPALAVWTQAVLVVHQGAYVARQSARARKARDARQRDEEQPADSTLNAAIASVLILGALVWAAWMGALPAVRLPRF